MAARAVDVAFRREADMSPGVADRLKVKTSIHGRLSMLGNKGGCSH